MSTAEERFDAAMREIDGELQQADLYVETFLEHHQAGSGRVVYQATPFHLTLAQIHVARAQVLATLFMRGESLG